MIKKQIVLLFLLLFAALPVFAWDDAGHKVTAFIAWERMTPEARDAVFKILSKAPEDSDLFTVYNAWETRSDAVKRRELFMFASIWGDVIRNRDFPVRYGKYNQGTWHYADVFWRQNGEVAVIIEEMSGKDNGGKAIPKLYEFAEILKNPLASDAEKSIALAWFLHVGGDIHNPLHNASRVTESEPDGDAGGNAFLLSPKDAAREDRFNLHSYWDQIISREMPRKDDWCDDDYISAVARKLTDKFPYSKIKDRLKTGDFEAWHKEGFAFLPKEVYAQNLERNEFPPKDYQEKSFRIGQEQLALAGYRLGETLNQIFGGTEIGANPVTPCKIIRKVLYPVSKTRTPDQKLRIALLDVCPPDKGKVARPMISFMKDGEITHLEYDVVKVFDTESEAKKYAAENKITDAEY